MHPVLLWADTPVVERMAEHLVGQRWMHPCCILEHCDGMHVRRREVDAARKRVASDRQADKWDAVGLLAEILRRDLTIHNFMSSSQSELISSISRIRGRMMVSNTTPLFLAVIPQSRPLIAASPTMMFEGEKPVILRNYHRLANKPRRRAYDQSEQGPMRRCASTCPGVRVLQLWQQCREIGPRFWEDVTEDAPGALFLFVARSHSSEKELSKDFINIGNG
jgi:hypothetical protein